MESHTFQEGASSQLFDLQLVLHEAFEILIQRHKLHHKADGEGGEISVHLDLAERFARVTPKSHGCTMGWNEPSRRDAAPPITDNR